jgi:hypothetical protein
LGEFLSVVEELPRLPIRRELHAQASSPERRHLAGTQGLDLLAGLVHHVQRQLRINLELRQAAQVLSHLFQRRHNAGIDRRLIGSPGSKAGRQHGQAQQFGFHGHRFTPGHG